MATTLVAKSKVEPPEVHGYPVYSPVEGLLIPYEGAQDNDSPILCIVTDTGYHYSIQGFSATFIRSDRVLFGQLLGFAHQLSIHTRHEDVHESVEDDVNSDGLRVHIMKNDHIPQLKKAANLGR